MDNFSPNHLPTKSKSSLDDARKFLKSLGFKPYTVFYGDGYKKVFCDCTEYQKHLLDSIVWGVSGHLTECGRMVGVTQDCPIKESMSQDDVKKLLKGSLKNATK